MEEIPKLLFQLKIVLIQKQEMNLLFFKMLKHFHSLYFQNKTIYSLSNDSHLFKFTQSSFFFLFISKKKENVTMIVKLKSNQTF